MNLPFTFNSKTSAQSHQNREANLMFIRYQENYFNDVLRVRGYLYFNDIYEAFGLEWNPEWENLYISYKQHGLVKLDILCANEDGFDIDIR